MSSFRAVRTHGDLPLATYNSSSRDESSESSSSEDSASSMSSDDGASPSNRRGVVSSTSTATSSRTPVARGRPGSALIKAQAKQRDLFGPFGLALTDKEANTASRPSTAVKANAKKPFKARFASDDAQKHDVAGAETSLPTAKQLAMFKPHTEGSLPRIDVEDLVPADRSPSKRSSSKRSASRRSASRLSASSCSHPQTSVSESKRPVSGRVQSAMTGAKTGLVSTQDVKDISLSPAPSPTGVQSVELPFVQRQQKRRDTRRATLVSDAAITKPQAGLCDSAVSSLGVLPVAPSSQSRRPVRKPSLHLAVEGAPAAACAEAQGERLFTQISYSSSESGVPGQEALDDQLNAIVRRAVSGDEGRQRRSSAPYGVCHVTSTRSDEEPGSPKSSRSCTRARRLKLMQEEDGPPAPSMSASASSSASRTPQPPLVPHAPVAPSGKMRRFGRPAARGGSGSSGSGVKAAMDNPMGSRDITDVGTEDSLPPASAAKQDPDSYSSGPLEVDAAPADEPSTCGRATFAGWDRSDKRCITLEYRPRIKFLNVLSSVVASVFEYVEAVAVEVSKAVLATRVFVAFADDVREEVYCMGPGELACRMKWGKGIVGQAVRDGLVGRFGTTDDRELEDLLDCPIWSVLCCPFRHMLDQGRCIGAIVATNKLGQGAAEFTEEELKTLQDITRLASDSFYRQRWKALEKASSKGDNEALALISLTMPRKCALQEAAASPSSGGVAGSQSQANMDLLSKKMVWRELPFERAPKLRQMQSLGFDALDYQPDELLVFVDLVMKHTGCVDLCNIPCERLRSWTCAAKWQYHENPFHNWYHGFSVFQMCYYQLHTTPLQDVFSALDVFGLLIASLCHDLGHPGFTNNYMVDCQSDLAMTYNDIAVLENHHASLACELLRRESTAISAGLDAAAQKALRRVVIKCILDTDMVRHSEMCQKLTGTGVIEDRQLMLGACVHSADLSAQTLPWKAAQKWEERISMEFTRQAQKEVAAGRSPAPFMSFQMDDVKQRGKLQRDFCDFVLLPLWDPYTQQLPALRTCYRNLVKNRSFYEHRWNTGEEPDPSWCK